MIKPLPPGATGLIKWRLRDNNEKLAQSLRTAIERYERGASERPVGRAR